MSESEMYKNNASANLSHHRLIKKFHPTQYDKIQQINIFSIVR